jgi:hypothetical protein
MVDEAKYLKVIRNILNKRGRKDIVDAIQGSICIVVSTGEYSQRRTDDAIISYVHFLVQWSHLDDFTEEMKRVLEETAQYAMPMHEQIDVRGIIISPNLDDLSDQEDQPAATTLDKQYSSIFGQPSLEEAFQCDVFMIMPFMADFEPLYRKVVSPTVTGLGLTIKRGDDPFSKHEIMHEIWSMLNACKLVIADCTGRNANVFYELGIAHAIGKPVIMLTQNLNELPFDVQGRRAIEYSTNFHEIDSFKAKLTTAIRGILPSPTKGIPF